MRWPWVSAARFEDLRQQCVDLKEANLKLLELIGLKQETVATKEEEEQPDPPRAHRVLGAEMRARFREQAEERKRSMGVVTK